MDRSPGRHPARARLLAAVGRPLNLWYVWLPLGAAVPRAVRGPAKAVPPAAPRPAGAAVLRDVPVLLQQGQRGRVGAARVPDARLSGASDGAGRLPPRAAGEQLMPYARTSWLVVGPRALMIFRVGLNVVDSDVMDVGYASVVGADRMTTKEELYVDNDDPRRHLRARELPGLRPVRAAVPATTAMGQGARGTRGRPGVRPARGDRPDDARRAPAEREGGAAPRRGHGVRMGGVSVHAARPAGQRERRPGGRVADLRPRWRWPPRPSGG